MSAAFTDWYMTYMLMSPLFVKCIDVLIQLMGFFILGYCIEIFIVIEGGGSGRGREGEREGVREGVREGEGGREGQRDELTIFLQ